MSPLALAAALIARTLQTARLMVGVPDYEAYVAHLRAAHPEATPMDRQAFVRAAQERRLGARGPGRCC